MTIVLKNRESFDTVQHTGVKSIAFANGVYTLTLANDTTVTYQQASYIIWLFG